MYKVWVDLDSGTWGDADRIRFIDFEDTHSSLFEAFQEGSDSYRMEAAIAWGHQI